MLLRSYSHYSLLSAVPKLPKLIATAKERGYTSLAITDEDTTSGLIEFYESCQKSQIKPILGVTLKITNLSQSAGTYSRHQGFSKVALLAKNEQGYKNLLELVSLARTVKEQPSYHVDLTDLQAYYSSQSDVNLNFFVVITEDHEFAEKIRSGRKDLAAKILQKYTEAIGASNVIVELLNVRFKDNQDEIKRINLEIAELCDKVGAYYKASPAPRYLDSEEAEPFQVVLAIKKQTKLYDIELERDFGLPSLQDLRAVFDYLPGATDFSDLDAQIDIKIRTDYDKHASEAFFPHFELPEGQDYAGRLRYDTYIGLMSLFESSQKSRAEWRQIYTYELTDKLKEDCLNIVPDTSKLLGYPSDYWQKKNMKDYVDRIERELDVIISKGFPSYFLVIGDMMQYCRNNGIVINVRGSAAGCLVGYMVGIGILDPLVYDLPFERFLNPFRPSAPDVDSDFADDRRQEVIEYLVNKYGKDNVSQITTFGTMLPRAAVRDIGRVLGISYRKCDQLSKLIPIAPQGRKTTFQFAFDTSNEFKQVYERDEEAKRIIDIALKIEGNYRHSSVHAAGVIITPTKLTDYCALQWDSDHKFVACQYDMRIAEKVGLVKMDILGITNLSILGNAVQKAEERHQTKINLYNIDITDQKAFNLLAAGKTMGIFQLSGAVMTKYLVQLEPGKVQDLMAMVALYRPGAMANIPDYIKRKHDPRLVSYMVPEMQEWMSPSFGILVYQDDLLYMCIRLAGYDWGEVDTFRKGMGKKIKEVIDSQHEKFVEGCIKHSGLTREKAEEIWEVIVPFSAYGFNKAHSANYGMVAYWTAYMKANYPAEFMTALMSSEEGDMDKITSAINECVEMGIQVLPPDVNLSDHGYTIRDDKTIIYGLGSVKNLGADVIDHIIKERQKNGHYQDMEDFLDRVSEFPSFNKRSLEALIFSGALDLLGEKVLV